MSYKPPDIRPELLDKLKTLYVYQHQTNGLFTYKRARGKPSMKNVNKFFRRSFQPDVTCTRLNPKQLKSKKTPKMLDTELAKVKAKRRQRRSVEEKLDHTVSPSIFKSPAQLEDLVKPSSKASPVMTRRRSSATSDTSTSTADTRTSKKALFLTVEDVENTEEEDVLAEEMEIKPKIEIPPETPSTLDDSCAEKVTRAFIILI